MMLYLAYPPLKHLCEWAVNLHIPKKPPWTSDILTSYSLEMYVCLAFWHQEYKDE